MSVSLSKPVRMVKRVPLVQPDRALRNAVLIAKGQRVMVTLNIARIGDEPWQLIAWDADHYGVIPQHPKQHRCPMPQWERDLLNGGQA